MSWCDEAFSNDKPQDARITQHTVGLLGCDICNYMNIRGAFCFPRTVKSPFCIKRDEVYGVEWSRTFLENLEVAQLVKKLPNFYRTRSFITANTTANLWALSSGKLNTVHILISYSLQIQLNIIVLSKPRSPKLNSDPRKHTELY